MDTVVTSPAIPAKSGKLEIPKWLNGSYRNNALGIFTFEGSTILFSGDMGAVGLDQYFPNVGSFNLADLVSGGYAAIKVKRIWHRMEVTIYTEQGDISFLFVKKGDGIDVSKSGWRYRKTESKNGGYSMFKSVEKGTVGHFSQVL